MDVNQTELEKIVFNVIKRIGNDIVFFDDQEVKDSITEILTEWYN